MSSPVPRAVGWWLLLVAAAVFIQVGLGGITRLTDSGLSITEWKPLLGVIPPHDEAGWAEAFARYQQIPQYIQLKSHLTPDEFRFIYFWEWFHRLWGRLLGVFFGVPFLVFLLRGSVTGMWRQLLALFVLGGLQGAVGWFMVASGFAADSTAVSAYRLVIHLVLALSLYSAIFWMALSLWRQNAPRPENVASGLRRLTQGCCAALALTIVAGGFVAGLKAGLTYNSFPLMDGHLVPDGYAALHPLWRNLTENIAAVQFDHRVLATMTAVLVIVTVARGLSRRTTGPLRGSLWVLGALVILQYVLGVTTLLWVVPIALGTAHQAVAVLLLSAALSALHAQRAPRPMVTTRFAFVERS